MSQHLRERLDTYDLDALLAYAIAERIIDGHSRVGDGLVVYLDGTPVLLDHKRAVKFVRGIVRAYAIGRGRLPPLPDKEEDGSAHTSS